MEDRRHDELAFARSGLNASHAARCVARRAPTPVASQGTFVSDSYLLYVSV